MKHPKCKLCGSEHAIGSPHKFAGGVITRPAAGSGSQSPEKNTRDEAVASAPATQVRSSAQSHELPHTDSPIPVITEDECIARPVYHPFAARDRRECQCACCKLRREMNKQAQARLRAKAEVAKALGITMAEYRAREIKVPRAHKKSKGET